MIFLTDSTRHLFRSLIAAGSVMGRHETYSFADGERGYRLKDDVKGRAVAIIASVLPGPESLFELIAVHRLAYENGAGNIKLLIPYLGYARQDRPAGPGEASIGIMVARLIRTLKPDQLILFDVHSDLVRKAFGPSAVELTALPLFSEALLKHSPDVIVSPDKGFVPRARKLSNLFPSGPGVAVIDKVRPRPNVAVARELHGDVMGKDALIVDDMIDTGGTIGEAIGLVSQRGARTIRLAATHGIFSRNARDRLSKLPIKEILVTNTLNQTRFKKIRVLDITPLLLKAISAPVT